MSFGRSPPPMPPPPAQPPPPPATPTRADPSIAQAGQRAVRAQGTQAMVRSGTLMGAQQQPAMTNRRPGRRTLLGG